LPGVPASRKKVQFNSKNSITKAFHFEMHRFN
jgi:hypothetical protein